VLQTAQQKTYFHDNGEPQEPTQSFWAETFASQTGWHKKWEVANPQYYINASGFACVVTEVNTMREYGRYPPLVNTLATAGNSLTPGGRDENPPLPLYNFLRLTYSGIKENQPLKWSGNIVSLVGSVNLP